MVTLTIDFRIVLLYLQCLASLRFSLAHFGKSPDPARRHWFWFLRLKGRSASTE